MGRISRTWSLMGASWQILKKDPEMLIFPLLSAVCCLIVVASFAIPLLDASGMKELLPPEKGATPQQQFVYYGVIFLFYFCNYFVIVFFNSAIVSCAVIRMRGGNPAVGDGIRSAAARLHLIVGWALVSATVGLILNIIENRSKKVGRFVAGLLGMAWSVTSFLVVPILIVEGTGPISALKESAVLLKKTWGEQLIGNFSFGLLFFLLSLPIVAVLALGFLAGNGAILIACIAVVVLYVIGLALVQSALQAIFQAAVYMYAREGKVPGGFESGMLRDAMSVR